MSPKIDIDGGRKMMKEDMDGVTLTPAYGRNPKTEQEALEMFYKGKDWVINHPNHRWCGSYCSFRDCNIGDTVKLRYNKKRSAVIVNVGDENGN